MGPVAFVIVFMLVPLAAALFAGGLFAAVGILRLLALVPTGAWATLTVAAGVIVAVRLWVVLRALNGSGPGVVRCEAPAASPQGPHALEEPGVGAPGGAPKPPEASLGGGAS